MHQSARVAELLEEDGVFNHYKNDVTRLLDTGFADGVETTINPAV